ncbi:MAG: hypothetical protein O7E54_11420 [Planctomycetota bacterium]|nr:hypothetical protein [Planctomycetota bacterium]
MPCRLMCALLILAIALPATAQDAGDGAKKPDPKGDGIVIKAVSKDEKVRTLKPKDVPAELKRLKSKADIKAEVVLMTARGDPVVFKGVIRNGKFIERIVARRFKVERTLKKPRCGVRLWWSGNSDGYIFFRYDSIDSLTIVGKLTAAERRALMKRLAAKKGEDKSAAPAPSESLDLEKLAPQQLRAYLLANYPYDKGWNHDRKRELSYKQLLENKKLSSEETIFLKYFSILAKARFEELHRQRDRLKIEPGSARGESDDESAEKWVGEDLGR